MDVGGLSVHGFDRTSGHLPLSLSPSLFLYTLDHECCVRRVLLTSVLGKTVEVPNLTPSGMGGAPSLKSRLPSEF